mgnify:CR=1 FL=1
MLSTMLMFRSLRFMPRFTSREKTTVSTAESTKLRGLMSRPNMTISTSTVRMMNTNSDTAGPFYVADTGSVILKLKWISSSRVLAVFDTYAAIINVSDGTESARYDYGGATLQSVSISGRSTALLLAVRGGDTLVTLDDSLNQLASVAAGQAKSVSSTATAVYLLTASGVESYGYDGTHNWSRDYGAAPQAVINARETLVFISGTVEVLNAPHE